jgi:hypothetical protein
MVVFNTYYKNKKSKLHFENRVTVPNDLIYGYGGVHCHIIKSAHIADYLISMKLSLRLA